MEKLGSSSAVWKATELKRELVRLVKSTVEEEDVSDDETLDQAMQVLSDLKDLLFHRSQPSLLLPKAAQMKKELARLLKSIREEEDVPFQALDQVIQVISDLKYLKAPELKRALERLLKSILEEEDVPVQALYQAIQVASDLKIFLSSRSQPSLPEFHQSQTSSTKKSPRTDFLPHELLLCPGSGQVLKDPVVLSSGVTFDRAYAKSWLSGSEFRLSRKCPHTGERLLHSLVTPNLFARKIISEWCKNQGMEEVLEPLIDTKTTHHESDEATIQERRARANELFDKISSGPRPEQMTAMKELRMLTQRSPTVRGMLGEVKERMTELVSLLRAAEQGSDFHADVVSTILNFSVHDDNNKEIVGDEPYAIEFLIRSMRVGNMDTRGNAAAVIYMLSTLDANRAKIVEDDLDAMEALRRLLEEGNLIAKKKAASAIYGLYGLPSVRLRAVDDGVLWAALGLLKDGRLLDEMLAIIDIIPSSSEATEVMYEQCGVTRFLEMMREESTSNRNREKVASILYSMCMNRRCLQEIREDEEANGSVAELAKKGTTTARARRKADGILAEIRREIARSPPTENLTPHSEVFLSSKS